MTYLDKMQPGQHGRILNFMDDSSVARRLVELGVIPGQLLEYIRNAPFGDPLEIKINNSFLLLRKTEAALVAVEIG